jgi:hypothetical protein
VTPMLTVLRSQSSARPRHSGCRPAATTGRLRAVRRAGRVADHAGVHLARRALIARFRLVRDPVLPHA